MTHRYLYLGTKGTDPRYVGDQCDPVLRADGRVVRGRGNQLVTFADGTVAVVVGRRLRLTEEARLSNGTDPRLTRGTSRRSASAERLRADGACVEGGAAPRPSTAVNSKTRLSR